MESLCSEGATGHQRRTYLGLPNVASAYSLLSTKTQPSWWRPKGMASALCNSSKQNLSLQLVCPHQRGEGKAFQGPPSQFVLKRGTCNDHLMLPGLSYQSSEATIGFLLPGLSCAVGGGPCCGKSFYSYRLPL